MLFSWIPFIVSLFTGVYSVLYPEEYCNGETFQPKCDRNEVVVITDAHYGRMQIGRCVEMDFGYLGCSENVLPYLGQACSGKHDCNFQVIKQNLGSLKPCPADLQAYLKVQYACTPVITKGPTVCISSGSLLLSQTQGYISSAVARDRGCGSIKAPWRIEAEPGQSFNVSLINYTPQSGDRGGRCEPLGYIYDVPQNNNVSICNTAQAEQHVYVSISHIVEIQLITDFIEEHNFLLHYTVVGCKDLQVSSSMWYKRDGTTVIVGCKVNKVSWNLKCEGVQWVGVVGNCTQEDKNPDTTDSIWDVFSNTYTVALIVVISLGVVLFIVTVLCVYCVGKTILHKRSQQQQVERNFYFTDSIQGVHAPPSTQSSLPLAYMLQGPPHDANDTYAERSCDLLPQYAAQTGQEEPQYFTLDKDYMDKATLQIR